MLQSDATPAEIAMSLGMKYEAAIKAIQRVRPRVALLLGSQQRPKAEDLRMRERISRKNGPD